MASLGRCTASGAGTPHSLDMTPHETPEEHADDVLLQTPLNSIYKQAFQLRPGLDPCGSFQLRIFYDSV